VHLGEIDWGRPWLVPYRRIGRRVVARIAAGTHVAEALNAEARAEPPMLHAGAVRFVAQSALPAGEAYEAFIARTAQVPTRDVLHDLFNGLVWLVFPRLKRRLNEVQAEQIARYGVGPVRGPVRDALTLFDESGAVLQAPGALLDALRRRDWQSLFVSQRADWAAARLTLVGHALVEKLARPRKAITAQVWAVPLEEGDAEAFLCARACGDWLAAKPGLPLPVLGVPGWWQANEDPGFYLDAQVFRPAPAPRRADLQGPPL
jgi:hypothetical protein